MISRGSRVPDPAVHTLTDITVRVILHITVTPTTGEITQLLRTGILTDSGKIRDLAIQIIREAVVIIVITIVTTIVVTAIIIAIVITVIPMIAITTAITVITDIIIRVTQAIITAEITAITIITIVILIKIQII